VEVVAAVVEFLVSLVALFAVSEGAGFVSDFCGAFFFEPAFASFISSP
jgi:hypothetical protein